jgi:acetylornithine deacetylase/succinyl-diaminopimelate desuccinylase-like protein
MTDPLAVPEALEVRAADLSIEQRKWLEAAWEAVDESVLRQLAANMTGIPSPTGEERALAEFLADWMRRAGLDGRYQPIDDTQGNAIGRWEGSGDGPDLLLYAPIDTLTTGLESEDLPWIGTELRADMQPRASFDGDWVVGLGAANPKGHGACLLAAAEAVTRAGIPLRGSLMVGLGAGGMPTNRRDGSQLARYNAGQGAGCSFLLEQGAQADFAIIAKPGWSVDWEEVGLCWFRVRVRGLYGYVGARHRIQYSNPIVHAATVIKDLEDWFPTYATRNTSGLVAPQGQVGWVEGGWRRTASLSPAACDFMVDLRVSPRTTPMEVRRQFGEAIAEIRARHPEIQLEWEMVLAIPGTRTSPDTWIVQSGARAWQAVEGKPYEPPPGFTSGATDANILRNRGIPTVRIGMPKLSSPDGREVDFALGMNAVDVGTMARLTRAVIYAIVDTCGRPRHEVGLVG